jgi:hypothetical protein
MFNSRAATTPVWHSAPGATEAPADSEPGIESGIDPGPEAGGERVRSWDELIEPAEPSRTHPDSDPGAGDPFEGSLWQPTVMAAPGQSPARRLAMLGVGAVVVVAGLLGGIHYALSSDPTPPRSPAARVQTSDERRPAGPSAPPGLSAPATPLPTWQPPVPPAPASAAPAPPVTRAPAPAPTSSPTPRLVPHRDARSGSGHPTSPPRAHADHQSGPYDSGADASGADAGGADQDHGAAREDEHNGSARPADPDDQGAAPSTAPELRWGGTSEEPPATTYQQPVPDGYGNTVPPGSGYPGPGGTDGGVDTTAPSSGYSGSNPAEANQTAARGPVVAVVPPGADSVPASARCQTVTPDQVPDAVEHSSNGQVFCLRPRAGSGGQ